MAITPADERNAPSKSTPRDGADAPVLTGFLPLDDGRRIARLILNAPRSLNALSLPMLRIMLASLRDWQSDDSIAAVFLEGQGEKAFCAGGDVVSLHQAIRASNPGEAPDAARDFFGTEYALDYLMHTYPKPIVCWGHGIVMGGGIGLLAASSHKVVTPGTRLAMPEITIGLFPDVAGSWFLPRMPGRSGLFLALTGAMMSAADARFTSLADHVIAHDARDGILERMKSLPWGPDRRRNSAALHALLHTQRSDDSTEGSALRSHQDRIDALIAHDPLEDLAPRLAALADNADPWLGHAGKTFAKGAISSAALTIELFDRARHLSLADVFRLEYDLALGCTAHHDFPEGVRALLVDKDRNPKWEFSRVQDIPEGFVEDHFRPRHGGGAHPLASLGRS